MRTCRTIVSWFGVFLSFLGSALPGDQVKQSKGRSTGEEKTWFLVRERGGKEEEGREKGEKRGEENPAALLTHGPCWLGLGPGGR